jgi:uncharacterized protein (TIGR02757 family)
MAATFQENQNNPSKSTQVKRNLPESMKVFLLEKAAEYEDRSFIEDDPIAIPHRYSKTDDIELAGFLTASLAWGNRKSILKSADALMGRMDHEPAAFLREASDVELQQAVKGFVHRTFQERDAALFFVALRGILKRYGSLEAVFVEGHQQSTETDKSAMADAIGHFHRVFFELAAAGGMPADRTRKHVAQPQKGSAAKRLNMYTRWMVRPATRGVDFGIWKGLSPADLMIPLDVHTGNVARKLELIDRKANDWQTVELMMQALRQVDPIDPVRMDFALFGLGAIEGF